MSDLKPCPFCGCDDVERIGFDMFFKERPHIKCHGCGADVYDAPNVSPIWHKHDSMTELWNTRRAEVER